MPPAPDEEITMEAVELDDSPKDEEEFVPAVDDESSSEEESPKKQEPVEPTFFSDEKGNLKFVNHVVRRPCCIFWTILGLCIFINFLLIAVVFKDGNPFSEPGSEYDVDDIRSIQYDSYRLALEEVRDKRDEAAKEGGAEPEIQSEDLDITYWVFEGENDQGVFGSAESISAMKEAFDLFLDDQEYDSYCKLSYDNPNSTECELPITPLVAYYASEWDTAKVGIVIDQLKDPDNVQLFNDLALCYTLGQFCELIPEDVTQEEIEWAIEFGMNLTSIVSKWDMKGELVEDFGQVTELVSYMIQLDVYRGSVIFGYDTNFSTENPVSQFSRGILFWGGPLNVRDDIEGGDEDGDTTTDEDDEAKQEQDEEDLKDYIVDNFLDDMDALAEEDNHRQLNSYYFMGALIFDVLIDIVAKDGMLAMISLAFVFVWLRINTGSFFLAGVGLLEIFFSIPVAWFIYSTVFQIEYFAFLNALSIFIVAAIGADDIFIFMDAYKQSKYRDPDNLESLETRMSWVFRRTGTAMAITSATTCSAFLCTLITPLVEIKSFGIFAACVIFIDYVLVMSLFCTAVVIYHDRYEDRKAICGCCTDCTYTEPSPTETAQEALKNGESNEQQGDRVTVFFRERVAPFVLVPWHRLVMLLLFVGWLSVATWQTTKLEPTKETEQFLDEDHPLQKSFTILNSEFPTAESDLGLKVYYTWGLGEVSRDGVSLLFDPFLGDPVFLDTFDFNEQCQTKLVETCAQLKTDDRYQPYIKRDGGVGSVFCFVEELAAFSVRGNLDDCDYVRQGEWKSENWQISPDNLTSVMESFVQQMSCRDQTQTIQTYYSNELGWDGESMRYASIAVESENLDPFSTPSEKFTKSQYDQFVAIAEEVDDIVSEFCTGQVIMTDLDQRFIFMNNQNIYLRTAIQSSVLGVAIAFTVLLLATRVFHIALFASLSIISVLVSVTGTMVMLGWNLGSIESVLISIIAGFSVDYVVHLAHAYESSDGDADQRVTAAFGDMGISVLNGMVTSVAASLPLFFCQLQFFAKFGTFLCLTIAFSWVFANFIFMSVLAQLKIPIKHGKGFRC